MALIYHAELHPDKMELLASWLPTTSWFPRVGQLPIERVGSFRFDDPEGQVGIETHLVAVGADVVQVPLTYRGAPLEGAEKHLITTMEHSVLGTRWVYDGCGDPAYAQALTASILSGQGQAPQYFENDGVREDIPESVSVVASGLPDGEELAEGPQPGPADLTVAHIRTADWDLSVVRILELGGEGVVDPSLTATWPGQDVPVLLAWALPAE
ncbi:hypothetical protein MUG94_10680 [Arthrobacter gengyunqii]|uniref:Maltokinase N-terminal cap domain-containing protein n=1 Tax=Arthrobacter gengyunqii TaxID=2886940 RepID=A0A9X1S7A1_9MICC|nr:hypothetical protein [Arthrobacter gengyunqii]MCC3270041.1 hypothetical protein [Arthrobacter gengyunqii]UOY95040.1 hypothetical protein MUG94_10680 [Arthrobacter gengyunqii]